MKKFYIIGLFILLIYCTSSVSLLTGPHFYTANVKDGYDILKMYDWQLVRIDTLKESQPVYIFYYKKKIP